jgi:hypothetical protein
MKSVVSVLALAAGVAATGFRNFPAFPCPANTDNKCTDAQKPGFTFQDLTPGTFGSYKDFNFKGFTCGGGSGGGRFNRRTGGKVIGGSCTSNKKTSPSFGCGPAVDKFSLGSIHVQPEFDCDLEFHYDMPDGSTCKHRNSCKKSGTTVVNSQCGGAKNVTIVFPPQPSKPKPTCSIDIHTISFDCNPPKTTVTRPPTTAPTQPTTTTAPTTSTTPTTSTVPTTSTAPSETTAPPADTSSKTVPPVESSITTPPAASSSTSPAESTTTPPVGESSKPPVGESSKPPVGESSKPPVGESSKPPVGESTTSTTTTEITTTVVTSFETTSTVFSTVVSTITSCAPTVPNCPANGGVTTTVVTVAISTTICPVTETRTTVLTSTSEVVVPPATQTTATSPVDVPPTGQTTTAPPAGQTTTASTSAVVVPGTSDKGSSVVVVPGTTTTANSPVETLPCPNVVPACLNTFLFSVGCSDNTDTKCYCPDSIFVKNVFECIYAHGETDKVVSEAVVFFQGICAPHIPSNPEIATGATVTKFITVTAAPTSVAPIYTTVIVDATTVVPCTDEAGVVIPSSSSTVIVSTVLTVPQVGFTTASGTVGVIPVTAPPQAIQNPTAPANAPVTTTFATAPLGTGGIRPTKTGAVVTAGSGRVTTGLGFSLAIAVLAAIGL